jgi:alginate O-acetyltransferase complex protein AlgI
MMPQFARPSIYSPRLANFAIGASFLAMGLVKKVLIADSAAPIANDLFDSDLNALSMSAAWLGTLAYTLQIYFDSSGYSDMAVGLSLLIGVRLPYNFNSPYKARSIVDFWRRWHITLSRFLRDYLYVPLGGNRHRCGGGTDRTPAFEPPAMWENEHITRHSRQTRRAVFGSAIDAA